MSMISAQIDELRELALWLDDEFYDAEAAKLRDAADTIWKLRDDLQRTNAENATLRQQLADVTESMGRVEERCAKLRTEFDKMDKWHSAELQAAMAENAKLRELVRDYERCTMHADCDKCEYDGKMSTHCPLSPCFPDTDELRELGIEVDG